MLLFGNGTHHVVLYFNGYFKVVQQNIDFTACLRKAQQFHQGLDLILRITPGWLANEVRTDLSILIYHNLFMVLYLQKLLPE